MATITKRGCGWYVQVRRKGFPPRFKTLGSKADAMAWARREEAVLDGQTQPYRKATQTTLRALLERYRDTITPTKRGASSETCRLSRMIVAPMGTLALQDLEPAHIAAYRDTRLRQVKPGTVRREMAILRSALEVARRDWGLALVNPAAQVARPVAHDARDRRLQSGEWERINEEGQQDWLIVYYKGNAAIFEEIRALVVNEPATRLHPLTWGRHHGTNDYRHISNVVIIGQLNYGDVSFHAHGAAASGLSGGQLSEFDSRDVEGGEFQHNLLQAVCRSSVRQSQHGKAGRCRAYVITSAKPDTVERVRATFPGCHVRDWCPVMTPLTGRNGEAADYLRAAFMELKVDRVRKADVYTKMGIHRSNFSAIIGHPDFAEFMGRERIFSEGQSFFKVHVTFEPHPGGGWTVDEEE